MGKEELLVYLEKEGFSQTIVEAFRTVKRENFVDKRLTNQAYNNTPLAIAPGATISQPYTIAFMLNLLELQAKQQVLEIGSGSGYVLALINNISRDSQIYGVEIINDLVNKSQKVLKNYQNIIITAASGAKGLMKFAPYDRILISAASETMPKHLFDQLTEDGILVCPVQSSIWQIKKQQGKIVKQEFYGFAFVPLLD